MVTDYQFRSKVRIGPKIFNWESEKARDANVKAEPMLWRCDLKHSRKFGGLLTHTFLDELEKIAPEFVANEHFLVDSRIHMLMPGWYPSIPGFHLDSVPRELLNKQPNHRNPSVKPDHCMCLVGDASLTEFALGDVTLPEIGPDEVYYRQWHPIIKAKIDEGEMHQWFAEPDRLIFFDWQAWHQGVKATKRGFRLFIRATINAPTKFENEIRVNSQVYLENPMEGW